MYYQQPQTQPRFGNHTNAIYQPQPPIPHSRPSDPPQQYDYNAAQPNFYTTGGLPNIQNNFGDPNMIYPPQHPSTINQIDATANQFGNMNMSPPQDHSSQMIHTPPNISHPQFAKPFPEQLPGPQSTAYPQNFQAPTQATEHTPMGQLNISQPPMPPMFPAQGAVPPNPNAAVPRHPAYPPLQQDVQTCGNQCPPLYQSPQMRAAGMTPSPPQPQKRVIAEGLPSAVEVIESNRLQCSGPFTTGQRNIVPPLVTTDFMCRDEGNCNPRFIRSSMYAVPTTSDLLKTVGIPFSLSVAPFAMLHPDDQPIIVSNMGEQGPVRCNRCRAYMNPFVCFIDGGRRFQCPLCSGVTEVPGHYFAHLDHTGRRTDAYHRPELCLGSYELLATAEYCKNNELPKPPAYIFLLDVSQSAVRSGLVQLFLTQFVDRILPKLPKDESNSTDTSPIKVAFITYDHQLHFYSFAQENSTNTLSNGSISDGQQPPPLTQQGYIKPQMHIVADVEDVFVPAVEGFLVHADAAPISSLLSLIPNQFAPNSPHLTADAMIGPAVQAGLEALHAANCPGKLFVFHANLPSAEAPGKLLNRDDRRLVGTEKEKTLLTPSGDFYTGLGQSCVEAGCSVDLFLFPNSFVDVATLAELPRLTGGHLYKYNCFQSDLQGAHFLHDLEQAVAQPKAFNAVMRVRTSTGVRPVDFYGNCYLPNTTDIELACVDPTTTITLDIRHDDKLQDNDTVFIQAACLFTSLSGQRRLRIHNLSLSTTSSIPEIFRLSELDAHMNWLTKCAMRALCNRAHPHVVDEMSSRAAHTLAAYRRHCSGPGQGEMGAGPGELVLPQNMKLYPLYVQCMMKTDAFMPADNVSVDDRALRMFWVNGMGAKETSFYLYPRLYPVHNLSPNFEGHVVYPPAAIRCSSEWLQQDGAYLLDNGVDLYLWLGSNLSSEWVQSVFNVPSARHFEPEKVYDLCRMDNETSRNLCDLVGQIHHEHSRHSRLHVVRPGDKLEIQFKRFLVEDRHSGNSVSYVEYLCHIHKEVCSLLR